MVSSKPKSSTEAKVSELLQSNPLTAKNQEWSRHLVLTKFKGYVNESNFSNWYLVLSRFATEKPLKFKRKSAVDVMLALLEEDPELAFTTLVTFRQEISHAIFSLLRPGSSWADKEISLDRPDSLAEFEAIWHPEYQRYIEHIFSNFVVIPLVILGSRKNKDFLSLTLSGQLDCLERHGVKEISLGCDTTVRNAISHGSAFFNANQITYKDTKQEKSLTSWEFSELFDDLVDTCNSLLFALLLFICKQETRARIIGLSQLPLGVLFVLVDSFTSFPGFRLLSMIESKILNDKLQLNIVCRIESKSRASHLMTALHIGNEIIKLCQDFHDKIFIFFDCGMPSLPALGVNLKRLKTSIDLGETVSSSFAGIFEPHLLWYDASNISWRVFLWRNLLVPIWKITRNEIITRWRELGIPIQLDRYEILSVENKSSTAETRLIADVVIHLDGTVQQEDLLRLTNHIVSKLRKRKIRKLNLSGEFGLSSRPRAIIIRGYLTEKRIRRLRSLSFKSEELLLIAEWIRPRTKFQPFYTRVADLIDGNLRIRLNPKYVFEQKQVSST